MITLPLDTFEKLNEKWGCNTPGSQLYFDKFQVRMTPLSNGQPLWTVHGYTPGFHGYVECGWLTAAHDYAGLIVGDFVRTGVAA